MVSVQKNKNNHMCSSLRKALVEIPAPLFTANWGKSPHLWVRIAFAKSYCRNLST